MNSAQVARRRDFILAVGGSLTLLAAAHRLSPAAVRAAADLRPAKRDTTTLDRLLDEMDARGAQFWSVPRKDGEFLHFLVKASRARSALEVGTSHGFSAIWIGLALEETGGRLATIEIDAARHDLARQNVAKAGLSQRIRLIKGDAHVEVTKLPGPFDFVFLDADKEGQVDYFNKLFPRKLTPGGILAVHNAIRQQGAMRDYLDLVRQHPDFDTVTVSATLDDGFCLSYHRRQAVPGGTRPE